VANACPSPPLVGEPGEPVRGVTPAQAETFCRFAGGRVPTGAEWVLAAMGREARRFAWGSTGLVCRRAAYGLLTGPCAEGASGPELAGSRPDGASPEGAFDLSGNVAEWTREARGYLARGGSYRGKNAAELKSWTAEATDARDDIGFRCAYPLRANAR
jgi:formylglycine-generating enzyme required for sulfatase activity